MTGPLVSKNNYDLSNCLVFKKLDEVEEVLNEIPTLVFTNKKTGTNIELDVVTWSKEKGLLLRLDDKFLEANEEYIAKVIWSIK